MTESRQFKCLPCAGSVFVMVALSCCAAQTTVSGSQTTAAGVPPSSVSLPHGSVSLPHSASAQTDLSLAAVCPPPAQVVQSSRGGYASIRGLKLYYEVHGSAIGVPLVLLHGGGSSIDVTYGRILPHFARTRRVIALDEQGHGRTNDREGPVRFDTSADDVAALLAELDVPLADVMGFSNGASVALQLTLRHPERVRKLVFASSMTKRGGASPDFWKFIASASFADMPQSLKDAFLRVQPDPERLRRMHDKDLDRMQHFPDVSDAAVRGVTAPTLLLAGDHDVPTLEHLVELSRLLPHASVLILPGGHGDYLGEPSVVTGVEADSAGGRHERTATLTAAWIDAFLDGAIRE